MSASPAREWAYLRAMPTCDEPGCTTTASQALYNGRNAHIGDYCTRHAGRALKRFKDGG